MGVSTDGQICFGVAFPESFEFPWDGDKFDGDIETWWSTVVCGYKRPFEIYDERGEYIGGIEPPRSRIDEYHAHRRKFDEGHPVPVELVNYCSGECPMYMIAVPSSVIKNRRGYPEEIHPENFKVSENDVEGLKKFLKEYVPVKVEDLEYVEKSFDKTLTPKWYLSSYWG